MAGAAVNQADLHVIDAMAGGDPARRTGLGLDVAGVVDRVGAGVDTFDLGEPVAALHFPHATAGTAAGYVVVPASDAAPVPDGIALSLAATVPLNPLTAAHGRRPGPRAPCSARGTLRPRRDRLGMFSTNEGCP
jgi:NADPH:quinone reductase-like Zn-dependent oxidoreductase